MFYRKTSVGALLFFLGVFFAAVIIATCVCHKSLQLFCTRTSQFLSMQLLLILLLHLPHLRPCVSILQSTVSHPKNLVCLRHKCWKDIFQDIFNVAVSASYHFFFIFGDKPVNVSKSHRIYADSFFCAAR